MGSLKDLIKKWIAVTTIIVVVLGQYALTGLLATSYAIDLLATQNDNVQFRAYFKNGEEELTEIESSIANKNLKLKVDVSVKNEGYFNGKIALENAGFKLGQATANNYIREINNNEISLNQINAGETASIEVGIEFLDDVQIQASTLNQTTTVKLQGEYTASNVSGVNNDYIDGGSDVKVIWTIPENTNAELLATVQTNSTYQINEENKKIVQFLTSSKLTNNAYPVKNTQITATIPTGATNVEVHKRTTKATNGEQEFTNANYSIENNVLTININNTETDGKISWMKGVNDILVITYEYPENTDLSAQTITINEKITTQNNVELNAEQVQLTLNEEKDGIASISKLERENSIYKGKIYSGEGREINSYSIVYVEYVDGIKNIEIKEEQSKFIKEVEQNGETTTQESNANVNIKSVKVNKDKVAAVLGNTWNLTIGETTITNETQADENGDIKVNLNDGIKTLTIGASKPTNNGSFIIETTKEVLGTDYNREQLKEFTKLKDEVSIKYTKNNDNIHTFISGYNINLKDTESKARLQSSQTALITSSDAQALNLTAILESSGEHQDLYKNPEIKVKLPSQVKKITYTQVPQLINPNGLQLTSENYKVIEENGQKVLQIKLTGEQTSYLGDGTTIDIKTNVELDQNAESSEEEIVMTYTNQNATKYTDNGTEKVNVQIIASQGNQDDGSDTANSNQGLEYELNAAVGGQTISKGSDVKAGEIITYTVKITNNGTTDKTGLQVEATRPDNSVIIERNPKYPKESFYTEDEIEELGSQINDNYFIEKNDNKITKDNISVNAGKSINIVYRVKVNENITQNSTIETIVTVTDGSDTEELRFNNIASTSNLKAEIVPVSRTGEDEIKTGYGYLYKLKIINLTNEEQKNVRVTINKNELINIVEVSYILGEEYERVGDNDQTFEIESIPANDIAYISISTNINQYTNDLTNASISASVADSAGNTYRSNQISEPVGGVKINALLSSIAPDADSQRNVKKGDTITYQIVLQNVGKENTNELTIKDRISNYFEVETIKIGENQCEYDMGVETVEDIEYDIYTISSSLNVGQEMTIEITGKVKNDITEIGTLNIINKAFISDQVELTETNEEVFYLKNTSSEENPDGNQPSGDQPSDDQPSGDQPSGEQPSNNQSSGEEPISGNQTNNNDTEGYSISGVVWKENEKDGQREAGEPLLEGIQVYGINAENNEVIKTTQTDSNGQYNLSNLEQGKYIVAFEFDTNNYNATLYKEQGINESENSDAVMVSKVIDNTEKEVAITDVLEVNVDQTNIDLGLVEINNSNVKIEKTVSKIIVTNKAGTKKYNFKNSNLAKVEIASKSLNGSNVVVEYKIKVKNTGSEYVYIKNIIDEAPASLEFYSSMNEDWYAKEGILYNQTLNDEKIEPGETKEVALTLIKKMTASNTGLVNNKAKIESVYSADGVENTNNDESSADVIISVKTGKVAIYIVFILTMIIITLAVAYISKKIIYEKERR